VNKFLMMGRGIARNM